MWDVNKEYQIGEIYKFDDGSSVVRTMKYSDMFHCWYIQEQTLNRIGMMIANDIIADKVDPERWKNYVYQPKPKIDLRTVNPRTIVDDLTNNQWKLFDYLEKIYPAGACKERIVGDLKDIYPRHLEDCKEENSTAYRQLRYDFQALQSSKNLMATYGCVAGNYKRLTEEEYKSIASAKWQEIVGMIKRQQNQDKRAGLDNQMRLAFNQEKDIMEVFK